MGNQFDRNPLDIMRHEKVKRDIEGQLLMPLWQAGKDTSDLKRSNNVNCLLSQKGHRDLLANTVTHERSYLPR